LGAKNPTFFGKFFQFARNFKEKNPKTLRPYKNISKPLPRKISGYASDSKITATTINDSMQGRIQEFFEGGGFEISKVENVY